MTDVLIVGGGAVGLSAAIALRAKGATVTVADAAPASRHSVECLMPDALTALSELGIELDTPAGRPFRGIRFCSEDSEQVATADFPSGVGFGQSALHSQLVRAAESAGVVLRWGQPVVIETNQEALVGEEPVYFKWLVGADGENSQVRRWAALEEKKIYATRSFSRRQYRIRPWSDSLEVYWGPLGEACILPLGEEEICVVTLSRDPQATMDEVLVGLPWLQARLAGGVALSQDCAGVTSTFRLRSVARGNVALLGAASGFVDALLGEGIALGLREAQLLVRSLEQGTLDLYERRHGAILQQPQQMARILLAMDRWQGIRNRALWVLDSDPALFDRLLGVHLGKESLTRFLLFKGLPLFRQMLQAPSALPR